MRVMPIYTDIVAYQRDKLPRVSLAKRGAVSSCSVWPKGGQKEGQGRDGLVSRGKRGAVSRTAARDGHPTKRARPGSMALRISIAHCKLQYD